MLPLSEKELDELVARERERGALPPPLTDWDSLADRLRAEGLIKTPAFGGGGGSGNGVGGRFAPRIWMQAAAAMLLVAGGAALGRVTAPAASSDGTATRSAQTAASSEAPAGQNAGVAVASGPGVTNAGASNAAAGGAG